MPIDTVAWIAEEEARTGSQRQISRYTVLFSHKLPESICAYAGFSVTLRLVGGRLCPSSMQNQAAATVQAHGSAARWKASSSPHHRPFVYYIKFSLDAMALIRQIVECVPNFSEGRDKSIIKSTR